MTDTDTGTDTDADATAPRPDAGEATFERDVQRDGSIELDAAYAGRLASLVPVAETGRGEPARYGEVDTAGTIDAFSPTRRGQTVRVVLPDPAKIDDQLRQMLLASTGGGGRRR